MASSARSLRIVEARSTAVTIRVVAFVVAALAAVSIPISAVAEATGHLPLQAALYAVSGAVALIGFAAIVVRPFDPLRP